MESGKVGLWYFGHHVAWAPEGRLNEIAQKLDELLTNSESDVRLAAALEVISASHLEGAPFLPQIRALANHPNASIRKKVADYEKYVADQTK